MIVFFKKSACAALAAMVIAIGAVNAHAQNGGLGLNPGRAEVEVMPGEEKTVGFHIDAPASDNPLRGHLLLSLTDWKINQDTSLQYVDAGSLPDSAAKWTIFSPSALSIESGQSKLVRVTVKVPEGTAPGVYRSGIFVQERPPATPPKAGEHVVMFRFRYLFSLYVMVGKLAGQGHFTDLKTVPQRSGLQIVCELNNSGTRHIRPLLDGVIRDSKGNVAAAFKRVEATVVLPSATNEEPIVVSDLPPGRYEIAIQVDFRDGRPIQAMKRTVEVPIS